MIVMPLEWVLGHNIFSIKDQRLLIFYRNRDARAGSNAQVLNVVKASKAFEWWLSTLVKDIFENFMQISFRNLMIPNHFNIFTYKCLIITFLR